MRKNIYLFLAAVLGLWSSCKKDSVIPPDPNYYNYYPTVVGSYITYQCDSIVYDDFNNTIDTFRFQIKEVYESEFTDNAGRRAIRIERFKKTDTTSWFLKDVWFTAADSDQAEKIEEDVRFIKLVFPVKAGKIWNSNALNSQGESLTEYINVHQPYSTTSLNFDSTLTTINTEPANLVEEFRNTEVYATGIGLVYKNLVDVKYLVPTPVIKSGVVFTMNAIEIGVQ